VKDFDLNKVYYDCSQNQIKIGGVKGVEADVKEEKTEEEKKAQ